MPTYTQIGSAVTVGAGGAASIDFSSIPSTYTDLVVSLSLRCTRASVDTEAYIKFNNVTSAYSYKVVGGDGANAASAGGATYPPIVTNAANATASTFSSSYIYIPNYAGSNNKSLSADSMGENNATTSYSYLTAGLWANSAAINQITITPFSGNFVQYSTAYLYGVSNA
jgi:hypothetical protein